jgi:hypothetical protein
MHLYTATWKRIERRHACAAPQTLVSSWDGNSCKSQHSAFVYLLVSALVFNQDVSLGHVMSCQVAWLECLHCKRLRKTRHLRSCSYRYEPVELTLCGSMHCIISPCNTQPRQSGSKAHFCFLSAWFMRDDRYPVVVVQRATLHLTQFILLACIFSMPGP